MKQFVLTLEFLMGLTLSQISVAAQLNFQQVQILAKHGVNLNPAVDLNGLSQECRNFIQVELPKFGWSGGFISVPQDYNKPSGTKILVFYYLNKSQTLPLKNPIFFFNGGPLTSYHVRMPSLDKQLKNYDKKDHSFVMMDQRGVGCSIPNMPESGQLNLKQSVKYSSHFVAQDAEIIRLKLFGNEKWKVYAQSYGGFLSARYLELFPGSITSMHVYGPTLHESLTDFFGFRILKQNDVLKQFMAHYPGENFFPAFEKISGPQGKKICLYTELGNEKVCGRALLDVILAGIGQGMGRGVGTTEIWDSVRDGLINLIQSNTDNLTDPKLEAFLKQAKGGADFFHNNSIGIVWTLWAQEFPFANGHVDSDCQNVYDFFRSKNINKFNLAVDECRIIKDIIPEQYKHLVESEYVQIRGKDFLTQKRILSLVKQSGINYYLYTGDLDSQAQVESLNQMTTSRLIRWTHFGSSGHAGWLYEPQVWNELLK